MYKNNKAHCGLLLLAAVIWGTAFVAQSAGMEISGPFTFNTIRFFIGSLVLIPILCMHMRRRREDAAASAEMSAKGNGAVFDPGRLKITGFAGIVCGCILAAAANLQQIAMLDVSAGKAGFLTALYIILVPVIGIFLGKKTSITAWLGVGIASVGLYFLCIGRGAGFNFRVSDLLLLGCALIFAFHILAVDHFNERGAYGVGIACIQFFTAAILSLPGMLLMDRQLFHRGIGIEVIMEAKWPILYAGVLSCGVAYTLQIVGQKDVHPALASMILSLESVTSVIAGFLILAQKLTIDELIGCVLMFAAIVLAQLPGKTSADT